MKKQLKRAAILLFAFIMLFTMVGCNSKSEDTTASKEDGKSKHLKIAMCLELPNIDFFTASKAGGMDAAAKDGNAEIMWLGSEDISELLSIIETQIDSGVDGICIQASNPSALINVIDKAKEKGIPCVVFNNTMKYDGYDGCVGMDPLVAGKGMGEAIEAILSGQHEWSQKLGIKQGTVPEGKIAFFLDAPGAYNLEGRKEGVLKVLSKYKGIKDVGSYDITSQGLAYAMEVIENVITANPDIKVLCSTCSDGTAAAGLAIQKLGLQDKILVIGMDTNETTLKLVSDGQLPMAFNQDPYNQGYLPVAQIIDKLRNGTEIPKVTSTKLITIKAADVNAFMEKEKSFKQTVAKYGK